MFRCVFHKLLYYFTLNCAACALGGGDFFDNLFIKRIFRVAAKLVQHPLCSICHGKLSTVVSLTSIMKSGRKRELGLLQGDI